MQTLRACNVQAMVGHVEALDRRLRLVSAHQALLFRERMYTVLSHAPRLSAENARGGIFEVETVWEIQEEARVFLEALRIDLDFAKDAPFVRTRSDA